MDAKRKRIIERIYGATKRNKLFVSPTKISIRYKDGLTEAERERIEEFLINAASMVDCDVTVRGHLACHCSDTYYIVLTSENKKYSIRVIESEFK